ncbi:MAG: Tim44/TimA family putative adaptor protein [Pseudomonadota bacterium]
MSSEMIQLLVLAGIVVFMVLRLRNALGTRDGFEGPPRSSRFGEPQKKAPEFEVIEGGVDRDITDHVEENSDTADALARMKRIEPSFSVNEFVGGARGAYEMILMAFEKGDLDSIRPFLADDVFEAFDSVVASRADQGLTVEAEFIGLREVKLANARFVDDTRKATIDMRFVAELTSVVKNADGEVVEGDAREIRRQKDVWSFSRVMGSDDPNWQLTATGE